MIDLSSISLSADVMTATSFFLTGAISAIAFIKRFREEARKSRVLSLEQKSLENLFHMRDSLRDTINRIEDLPDVSDDISAQELYSGLRSIRRTLRELVQDYFLYGDDDSSQKYAQILNDAELHYAAFLAAFRTQNIDYSVLNRFKQVIYDLLEEIELKILGIYDENGAPRKMAIANTRDRYIKIREEIHQLNS
jgi:hypothetical protein